MKIAKMPGRFCALIMLISGVYSQNPNFHIYPAFGQSNMEGQGSIESPDRTVEEGFKTLQALK